MSLFALDQERDKLAERHPGWRVWYVPHVVGGVKWHAQREPTLDCVSPAELDDAITEVEREGRN